MYLDAIPPGKKLALWLQNPLSSFPHSHDDYKVIRLWNTDSRGKDTAAFKLNVLPAIPARTPPPDPHIPVAMCIPRQPLMPDIGDGHPKVVYREFGRVTSRGIGCVRRHVAQSSIQL